ncbi:MAG: hemerythrin domain-containing protein [Alphaproteobacteria bacterium]|nr:hemerythrin domain-containing protein [Alphaproteobacteria bacterium]MCB9699973.1 hemerythrin domain-containing protein [Alphaproteobacteria bacterium]
MKRDPRLRGLSDDHHQALLLGRQLLQALDAGETEGIGVRIENALEHELAPHFDAEELLLVPAMEEAGLHAMSERLKQDHAHLRCAASAAGRGVLEASRTFAELLIEHVRFEERVLFPEIEQSLPDAVLDAVARQVPWAAGASDD